jgi:hypothetical protein
MEHGKPCRTATFGSQSMCPTWRSAQHGNKTQQEIYSHFVRIRNVPKQIGRTRRTLVLHWIANSRGVTMTRRPCSQPGVHDIASWEGEKKTSALKCHQTHCKCASMASGASRRGQRLGRLVVVIPGPFPLALTIIMVQKFLWLHKTKHDPIHPCEAAITASSYVHVAILQWRNLL